ncbi:hypothetical protein DRE_06460 [Drechslerella stenobrocha 248]|uniref:Uncharacterized protein n=1 Tax=Drechslerella stenobrocha 248 TaxID=1043628 RepID=W7HXH9_9PEZI|nr:hypothetical protein DRE_06460 [Drechslerella stenobrocha 248]
MVCIPPEPACTPNITTTTTTTTTRRYHIPTTHSHSHNLHIDTLFHSGHTSYLSGHHHICPTATISSTTFHRLITAAFPRATDFHIKFTAADSNCSYTFYQFDTRADAPDYHHADGMRGVDWGDSGIHIYRCRDALTAELLFKEWLSALYPGWIPRPLAKGSSVGQYALEQEFGLLYWVRHNIFVKLDIDDRDIGAETVHRLARSLDEHFVATAVPIRYGEDDEDGAFG